MGNKTFTALIVLALLLAIGAHLYLKKVVAKKYGEESQDTTETPRDWVDMTGHEATAGQEINIVK